MQLKSVSVNALFGRFDHRIPINLEEKITIITAPNGYGKTVILNLIMYFFTRQFHKLLRYSFDVLEFEFSNGSKIRVHGAGKRDLFGEEPKEERKEVLFEPINFSEEAKSWPYRLDRERSMRRTMYDFERLVPFLQRVDRDAWLDDRTGGIYSSVEVIEQFTDYLPEKLRMAVKLPDWLEGAARATECHLIETQRLLQIDLHPEHHYPRSSRRSQSVVERNAEDLSKHISAALQHYANDSQKLDQSFPKRVLQRLSETAPPEESIRARLQSLEKKRTDLVKAGLLDKSYSQQITAVDFISDNNIRNILGVYVSDTEDKLSVFDDLYERISLFQDIMAAHFRFKRIDINARSGMSVFDDSGNRIPINELSSGEQHELVLIYDLLFKVSDNALILIDEPELSLHVGWQKRFISDIERIQKLRPLTVIMATHSPQIISDRWDLAVDLAGE